MRTMRTVETMKTMSKHHHRKLDFEFKRGNKRLFWGKKRRREETHSLVFIIVTRHQKQKMADYNKNLAFIWSSIPNTIARLDLVRDS
ncbi:Hypothetical predicted protein [Olea europaea subsp. europaea]|uniref:Uncharacterized protein n=1 Tax=Olea europaea subsp. europaea TaxID=158383 RepID=A0A8S0R433_OLEEU|nr:Hypothetical predicted protein [Olea europaea subsp. europaea]